MNIKKLLANLVYYGLPMVLTGIVVWVEPIVGAILGIIIIAFTGFLMFFQIMNWANDNK